MKFEDYLKDIDFEKLIGLWNEYSNEFYSEQIYNDIEEFSSIAENDGLELARKVFFGKVRSWSDPVYINGYGNFESCWDLESSPIDIANLAEWLKDKDHEVYKEWVDEDIGEFPEWLAANNSEDDLHKLWVEYMGDPICGFTIDQVFNIDKLAQALADFDDELYQDWLEEQEDEEV